MTGGEPRWMKKDSAWMASAISMPSSPLRSKDDPLGLQLFFDPLKEAFVECEEANRMRSRRP